MIKFDNVSFIIGNFMIKNISFEIKKGEHFYIIGKSGIGKTLILELIAGRYLPHKGNIYFYDEDFTKISIKDKNLGFVYQDFVLYEFLNVRENIKLPLKFQKMDINERDILDYFDIRYLENRKINTLSGGEKQRVAICRALVTKPNILLLDEAYNALDEKTKFIIREKVENYAQKNNITIVEVTHNTNDIIGYSYLEMGDENATYIK